jgi:cell division protein FtsB
MARRSFPARLLWFAVILAALVFAVQGGEYSTLDLVRQRREHRRMVTEIDSLTHLVDSLRSYRDRLLHDPKLQERVARENFGMVRGTKELLYRFAEPRDSSRDSSGRPRR